VGIKKEMKVRVKEKEEKQCSWCKGMDSSKSRRLDDRRRVVVEVEEQRDDSNTGTERN
jgi:hypothetical protein